MEKLIITKIDNALKELTEFLNEAQIMASTTNDLVKAIGGDKNQKCFSACASLFVGGETEKKTNDEFMESMDAVRKVEEIPAMVENIMEKIRNARRTLKPKKEAHKKGGKKWKSKKEQF